MIARLLMALSAGIPLLLGTMHLVYTFHGPKLLPRDRAVQAAMEQTHLVLTRQTTLWRAYVGFNATHSMALILFGVMFGFLAAREPGVLFASPFLLGVGFLTLASFLALSRLYFFSSPFIAVCISLACYVASIVAFHS
jgi:hypothetical protein